MPRGKSILRGGTMDTGPEDDGQEAKKPRRQSQALRQLATHGARECFSSQLQVVFDMFKTVYQVIREF